MGSQPSQRSLGLLRQILEAMEPPELLTVGAKKKFWKDTLFDFGFSPAIIDIARSYDFKWSNIVPDLFTGNFQDQYSRYPNGLSSHLCGETLGNFLALAIHQNRGKSLTNELQRSLRSDGFRLGVGPDVDSAVPAELAGLPGRAVLTTDLDARLKADELVSVLFMDLDGFKAVNDTLGHARGDDCLIAVASSLNAASDKLTKVVSTLDESLKKLNVGINAWVTFRHHNEENGDPSDYDEDQIGYCKVRGTWGIALRHIWGNTNWADFHSEGPWLFNDAPRDMRIVGVDKIPKLIETLSEKATQTTKEVLEKTEEVRKLAGAIEQVAKQPPRFPRLDPVPAVNVSAIDALAALAAKSKKGGK